MCEKNDASGIVFLPEIRVSRNIKRISSKSLSNKAHSLAGFFFFFSRLDSPPWQIGKWITRSRANEQVCSKKSKDLPRAVRCNYGRRIVALMSYLVFDAEKSAELLENFISLINYSSSLDFGRDDAR